MLIKIFYIGLVFLSLATYADPNDGTFQGSSCTGAPITHDEALAHFQPGNVVAWVGSYEVHARQRLCDTVTGCADWVDSSKYSFGSGSALWLEVNNGQFVWGLDNPSLKGYVLCTADIRETSPTCENDLYLRGREGSGVFTDHCMRIEFDFKDPSPGTQVSAGQYIEIQSVLSSQF